MKYLSICSGIEAVTVAWQPLGWTPVAFAEIDPFCCWLLRSRYRASRPLHMPSPNTTESHQEAKQRAAAIRNVIALPKGGDIPSIRAASGGSSNSYLAFSAKDYGADADEIAPTLRGMGHDASHANGGGQFAIAVPLTASYGSPRRLDSSDTSSGPPNILHSGMAVRRLTPRECERLQGFPDDYTLVEYRGKSAADGPRYRALGNSMAVPVMRWIGERIAAVHKILMHRNEAPVAEATQR